MSYESKHIDGDVSVGRNTAIGGDATVQGKTHLKGNVIVDGWLEAKNIKGVSKGLFTTIEKLKAAYPYHMTDGGHLWVFPYQLPYMWAMAENGFRPDRVEATRP